LLNSGGYGTNGAKGGNAGKVLITVNEDDLDLLVPIFWDVRGGKGGASGTHGDPGDGGLAAREGMVLHGTLSISSAAIRGLETFLHKILHKWC
jgi:hypothetical protein